MPVNVPLDQRVRHGGGEKEMSMTLLEQLKRHIDQMAPHQRDRVGGLLMKEAMGEIERLREVAMAAEIERLLAQLAAAPVAVIDARDVLGLCALTETDFPALYALQGRRVALVDLGPNV